MSVLPIENTYLNDIHKIDAVTVSGITVQTTRDFHKLYKLKYNYIHLSLIHIFQMMRIEHMMRCLIGHCLDGIIKEI